MNITIIYSTVIYIYYYNYYYHYTIKLIINLIGIVVVVVQVTVVLHRSSVLGAVKSIRDQTVSKRIWPSSVGQDLLRFLKNFWSCPSIKRKMKASFPCLRARYTTS